jgi:hypothetical protein
MKILFFLLSTILSSNVFSQDVKHDDSITVHNLTNENQHVWVNAVSYDVSNNTSLRVPCNLGENIEVQHIDESVILSCGSKKEVK